MFKSISKNFSKEFEIFGRKIWFFFFNFFNCISFRFIFCQFISINCYFWRVWLWKSIFWLPNSNFLTPFIFALAIFHWDVIKFFLSENSNCFFSLSLSIIFHCSNYFRSLSIVSNCNHYFRFLLYPIFFRSFLSNFYEEYVSFLFFCLFNLFLLFENFIVS